MNSTTGHRACARRNIAMSENRSSTVVQPGARGKVCYLFMLLLLLLSVPACGQDARTPEPGPAMTIYVVNEDDDTVSVIDGATRSVMGTIPVGKWPHYVALDPAGTRAYVTNGDSNTVSVIDTATNRVTSTIEGVGSDPQQIVIDPAGKSAYVPCYDSGVVHVIDLAVGTVSATIRVGESPQSVAISPDGGRVYVVNLHSPEAMVIDTATHRVTATFTTGEGASGMAVSPDGRRLYLGGHGAGMWAARGEKNRDIRVIDPTTFQRIATIRCGIMPIAVKFSPDGGYACAVSHGSGEVHLIETATNKASGISAGSDCRDAAFSPDGKWLYVSNRGDNTVSVIDVAAKEAVAKIPVGRGPMGIAVTEALGPAAP
ncbi:MAG: beta-propeller fold lactonase family protein [Chloroflexi bacterium]|nr:beta-propeller fold lactonase family protein [Chloroflexota bacterium]